MKKRLFSAILAAMMLASTSVVAFAEETPAPEKSVEKGTAFGEYSPNVETKPQDAIVEFSVPTAMTVALDPFQAGDTSGSQVYSKSQAIYNKSNIPIRVTVKAGAVVGGSATLEADPSDVTSSDITDTDKKAYVELVAEPATATADRSGAIVIEATKLEGKDYATAYAEATGADTTAKVPVKAATVSGSTVTYDNDSQISFALQAATYAADRSGVMAFSALAADNKGVASFRFMGSLNANAANWTKDDLSVKVVYDVNGMGSAAYKALIVDAPADKVDTKMKAANVYAKGAPAGGSSSTETAPSLTPTEVTATFGSGNWDVDPTTAIAKGDWDAVTVTGVTWATDAGTTKAGTFTEDTDFTFDGTDFAVLGNTATSGVGLKTTTIDASATELVLTIAIENSDGSKTGSLTFTVNLATA